MFQDYNYIVSFVFFSLICLSCVLNLVFLNGKNISLNITFNLFVFFFLGLAPVVQILYDSSFFGVQKLTAKDHTKASVINI